MSSAPHRLRLASRRGFTLVEIMMVVVIIGLLAALAIPAFQRVRQASQNSTVANDFRVFSQAFESYAAENGSWPSNVAAGVVPPGMGGSFKTDVWQNTTPIGGRWNWDKGNFGITAAIAIQNFTCDDTQLAAIDAKIDDGDLSTGLFLKTATNRVTLILEP